MTRKALNIVHLTKSFIPFQIMPDIDFTDIKISIAELKNKVNQGQTADRDNIFNDWNTVFRDFSNAGNLIIEGKK